jgi:hypothetical protein
MNQEDLLAAILFGASAKISPIIHDIAVSMGLDTPLTLAALILVGVLAALSLLEEKHP